MGKDGEVVYLRHLLIGLTMLAAASLALALVPRQKLADQGPRISLEAMIPKQFGEWKLDDTADLLVVDPGTKAKLDWLYDQMLTRTYISSKGERVMLSIAYGDDQSHEKQAHLPEVCYAAQGFQIKSMSKGFINVSGVKLPVMKLIATQGQRVEPITYWVMTGNIAVRGRLEQEVARWKYGLSGQIPSGVIIRVSTISKDQLHSYRIEEQFVRDMLGAVPREYKRILIGSGF